MTEYENQELDDDEGTEIDFDKIETLEKMILEKYPKFDRDYFPCVRINEIEKGKYKPVCYVCNSCGCLVTEFIVGAIDRETETHGIWFVYDQCHGPEYAWHVLGLPDKKEEAKK